MSLQKIRLADQIFDSQYATVKPVLVPPVAPGLPAVRTPPPIPADMLAHCT